MSLSVLESSPELSSCPSRLARQLSKEIRERISERLGQTQTQRKCEQLLLGPHRSPSSPRHQP